MTIPIDLSAAGLSHFHAVALERGVAIDLRITGVIRRGSSEVVPVSDCARLHVGDRLLGSFTRPAGHHGRAQLRVRPAARPNRGMAWERARSAGDERAPSGTWELDTTGMRPRAYTLSLQLLGPSPVGEPRCYGSVSIEFSLTRGDPRF